MNNNNNNDSHIHQIIAYLASAANVAADGVTQAFQGAGSKVGGTIDNFKVSFEINRLNEEQCKLFSDIGRTMFLIKNGTLTDGVVVDGEPVSTQDMVDELLQRATEKQSEIDELNAKRSELTGKKICSNCSRICDAKDVFCASCGEKLPEKQTCSCGCEEEDSSSEE